MRHTTAEITTQDGSCPAHVLDPESDSPTPGVLVYMDGIGMRSSLVDIAARIASAGYYVLLPDLYYRTGHTGAEGIRMFADEAVRANWIKNVVPTANATNVMRDTEAFLAHFAAQPNVNSAKIGITGYCMGGRLSLYAAGHFGDRITAAASYHGGGLATDAPESPHRLAPQIAARVYVAGAIEDPGFDDAQKERLERALTDAGVDHKLETYNARHGWVPSDTPVHDPVETERHWSTLLKLFEQTLN